MVVDYPQTDNPAFSYFQLNEWGQWMENANVLSNNLINTYKILIEPDQSRLSVVVKYQDGFNHDWALDLANQSENKLLTKLRFWAFRCP